MNLRTDDFDYRLPAELIAQTPADKRDDSRLLVVDRRSGSLMHDHFSNIGEYLHPGDLLVANRSRVIRARLWARKSTGGRLELLLLRPSSPGCWRVLARPSSRIREGTSVTLIGTSVSAVFESSLGEGEWLVSFPSTDDVENVMAVAGEIPLPPYIRNSDVPAERYQTVYADREGSVAAPTAGLHFTRELLHTLEGLGIPHAFVTLHVGLGTFRPVSATVIAEHRMHSEWGEVTADVAEAISRTRHTGGRVVAVGTTTVRLLESASRNGNVEPFAGDTDIFIFPGYRLRAVDALITNFHLPRSTLLMLVSAFAGRDLIFRAYREAIERGYRFYSFGDAMLIL